MQLRLCISDDLAIAKVAMPLQAKEKPTNDNVFFHLGPFHITCAFFSMFGKHILSKTRVLTRRKHQN